MIELKPSGIPIYLQIYTALRTDIERGVLPPGHHLEPERRLAQELNINRATVTRAYQKLAQDGFILSRKGSFHMVSPRWEPQLTSPDMDRLYVKTPLSYLEHNHHLSNDNIYNKVVSCQQDENSYYFTGVVIPEELYPTRQLKDIVCQLLEEKGPALFGYCSSQGLLELRENISLYLKSKNVDVPPGKIIVGTEIMQMMDWVLQVYIQPGDCIVASEPIFPHTLQLFQMHHAQVITIPMDKDGMRMDRLESALASRKVKLIYEFPTFHNPTNRTMSPARREELLRLAHRYGVPIVEHGFLEDIQYGHPPVPPLKSMDANDFVIYIATFNQTLIQGVPIGFVAANRRTIDALTAIVQLTALQMSTLDQYIVSRALESGLYQAQVDKVRQVYARKQQIMYEELDRCAELGLTYLKHYGGGMVWCMLPDYVDSKRLLQEAKQARIYYHPGELFFPNSREGRRFIRLSFFYPTEDEIRTGIRKLADLIRAQRPR